MLLTNPKACMYYFFTGMIILFATHALSGSQFSNEGRSHRFHLLAIYCTYSSVKVEVLVIQSFQHRS